MTQKLSDIIRKGAAKVDGSPTANTLEIHVQPATFISTGKDKAGNPLARYKAGDVVRQVRVGSHRLGPEHVEALFVAAGVTGWDEDKLAALFAVR